MSLKELIQIIPPPKQPLFANPGEKERSEGGLGLRLPEELLAFGTVYGSGVFRGKQTTYLYILNPFSPHYLEHVNFECQRLREVLEHGGEDVARFNIFPEKGGLLPLGADDLGTVLWWRTDGSPEQWTIIIRWADGEDGYSEVKIPLTQLLIKMFTRALEFVCWPKPWLIDEIFFEPVDSI